MMGVLQSKLEEESNWHTELQSLVLNSVPAQEVYRLVSDFTSIAKPHSARLAERGFVPIPNCIIQGNKPIDIGYQYSYVNLGLYDLPNRPNDVAWSLPLSQQRLEVDADKLVVARQQLHGLLEQTDLPFSSATKVVNMVDSAYGQPRYIRPLVQSFDQLLVLPRLRYGSKIYCKYTGKQKTGGRNKSYEDAPYYLQTQDRRMCYNPKTKSKFEKMQRPIFELDTTEQDEFEYRSKKGKKIIVQLCRWNDLLLRGTRQHPMDDMPFDLVAVKQTDKITGKSLFQRPLFIAIFGQQRHQHSTKQTRQDYLHRYDIEPFFRFSKQQLLLNKYQSPDVQHFDAWVQTCSLAHCLLYLIADQSPINVPKWQQYLPQVKQAIEQMKKQNEPAAKKSPAITRKGAEVLFSTLDWTEFAPQESKNGRGRQKGTRFHPRTKQSPRRKLKKKLPKIEKTTDSS